MLRNNNTNMKSSSLAVLMGLALVLTLVGCSQYVPIPKKHPGVLVGNAGAQVTV